MTNHRERARQIVANHAPDSLQAALVHAVLDLAEAVREGHASRPAKEAPVSHSDVEDLVVVTVQQRPDRKAFVYSGTLGTKPVAPEDADLIVLTTPAAAFGAMDLLIYTNQGYNQLVCRVVSPAGIRRTLNTKAHGTTVTMTRALADEVVTVKPPDPLAQSNLPGFNR